MWLDYVKNYTFTLFRVNIGDLGLFGRKICRIYAWTQYCENVAGRYLSVAVCIAQEISQKPTVYILILPYVCKINNPKKALIFMQHKQSVDVRRPTDLNDKLKSELSAATRRPGKCIISADSPRRGDRLTLTIN